MTYTKNFEKRIRKILKKYSAHSHDEDHICLECVGCSCCGSDPDFVTLIRVETPDSSYIIHDGGTCWKPGIWEFVGLQEQTNGDADWEEVEEYYQSRVVRREEFGVDHEAWDRLHSIPRTVSAALKLMN